MIREFWHWFAIENSIVVVVFALLAELLSRRLNNARIANLLWMIVLAKFMIPSFLLCEVPLLPPRESLATASVVFDSDQFEWSAGTTEQPCSRIESPMIPSTDDQASFNTEPATQNAEILGSVEGCGKRRMLAATWMSSNGARICVSHSHNRLSTRA